MEKHNMFYEVTILGQNKAENKSDVNSANRSIIEVKKDTSAGQKVEEKAMDEDTKKLMELMAKLEAAKASKQTDAKQPPAPVVEGAKVPKNKRPGKPNSGRKYVLLTDKLKSWGKIPQQQADIAKIMAESMVPGTEWTEEELFELLKDSAKEYPSLANSKQDVTYLFRYYRGLKNEGPHAGFIARDFVKQIG